MALLATLALWPAAFSSAQTARHADAATGLPSLGDSIARDIYRDPDYLDNPVLGDYLQSVGLPLQGAARKRGDVPAELSERLAWELMISLD